MGRIDSRIADREDVKSVVLAVASEISGMTPASIDESTRIDDLELDSLGQIELTVAIEDSLDVHIGCGERVGAETLGCFVSIAMANPRFQPRAMATVRT